MIKLISTEVPCLHIVVLPFLDNIKYDNNTSNTLDKFYLLITLSPQQTNNEVQNSKLNPLS